MNKLRISIFWPLVLVFLSSAIWYGSTKETSTNQSKESAQEYTLDKIEINSDNDYEEHWKRVDSLRQKGLFKSALEEVQAIYDDARKTNNHPQAIKALIHKMKFNSYMQEDDYVLAIYELSELAEVADFPLKQIAHSITAEVMSGYYFGNEWKFANRTQTVDFDNQDIRTWDLKRIADNVIHHYQWSLTNAADLKRIDLDEFKDIVYMGNSADLRPTLYDFLAHRAIDFFQNTKFNVDKPADQFLVKNKKFFYSAKEFASMKLSNGIDSLNNQFYAAVILQELTRFHLNDKDPATLIDVELKRLNFSRNQSVLEGSDSLYLAGLENLFEKNIDHESAGEIAYEIANWHSQKGDEYQNGRMRNLRWEKKKAHELATKVIKDYPDSYGAEKCKSLLNTLEQKSLSFNTTEAMPSIENKLASVSYKNVNKLYAKVVSIPWDWFLENKGKYGDELMEQYLGMKVVADWEFEVNNPGDFHNHITEIELPEMGKGQYVMLLSPDKEFSTSNNAIAYNSFWISDLSYVFRSHDDEYLVQVLDRNSGKPVKGASVQLYEREYQPIRRKYGIKKVASKVTGEDGTFKIEKTTKDYHYYYIDVQKGDDQYNNLRSFYSYRYNRSTENRINSHIFQDRAIYRPGQTIHFKGILVQHNGDKREIVPNKNVTVTFYDANYQKVASHSLKTNEYGTYSGTFTAPQGMLNGQMHITDGYGTKYFSVEEYKRPKFEVKADPVEGSFRVDDSIKVTGKAVGYAGNNIDGAEVKYRITRAASFPYWRYWWWYPSSSTVEIANGEVTTDENGVYEVSFKAIPDESIKKNYLPVFSYTVNIDVVDITGETQSTSSYVMAGYHSLQLSMGVRDRLETEGEFDFPIYATNLNGTKVPTKGQVKVYQLTPPEGEFRKRVFSNPDEPVISEKEFNEKFPLDLYHDSLADRNTWSKKEVLSKPFNTETRDSIELKEFKKWKPGYYVVVISAKDAFGEKVMKEHHTVLFDKKAKQSSTIEPLWMVPVKTYCEPGENAEIVLATAWSDVNIKYEVEQNGKITSSEWITLDKTQKHISIPVKEEHRGNFVVHFTMVRHNRAYSYKQTIIVPHTNKMLDIELATYRDKMLPGSKEEWTVTVKGKKGEKVAAEMLATMYDASLDQFRSNYFSFNVWNSYYSSYYWTTSYGFGVARSQLYNNYWNDYYSYNSRSYPYLNWFGYSTYYYGRNYYGYYDDFDGAYARTEGLAMDAMVLEEAEESADESTVSREVMKNGSGRAMKKAEEKSKDNSGGDISDLPASASQTVSTGEMDNRNQDKEGGLGNVKARTNLSETAFFYPHLKTNDKGEVVISFTAPEALTRWKFMAMAHTKDLMSGTLTEEVITQKELMVLPNMPRFFRENDEIIITAKVSNVTKKDIAGKAQLFLFDAVTMKPLDDQFKNAEKIVEFSTKAGQSTPVSWTLNVPEGVGAVLYRIVAKGDKHSDGEEAALPVLSNRMMVTETMPVWIKHEGTKSFTFDKLKNSNSSSTLKHHALTLEFTSNPAWYAIQAMPYMMEYPYECSEQTFSRYYANAIATHIMNSNPKIKRVFDVWRDKNPDELVSNLQKNEELKALFLEETPWVLQAQDETKRKQQIALLFDLNKMSNELRRALKKLEDYQYSNGGWPWFPGMRESRYITQHIITGMGHLDRLGIKDVREDNRVWRMVTKGVEYLDGEIVDDYNYIKKHYPNHMAEKHISYTHIQYLYGRSYFLDIPMNKRTKEAVEYFQGQMKKYWLDYNIYMEGMIALAAHRMEMTDLAADVMKSLKERAIVHEELGMYWKDFSSGYNWWQMPIETQALMIEAFDEVANDMDAVAELKVWLLKNKQTNDWKTTKATAEACYALMLRGTDWLADDEPVEIKMGGKVIDPKERGEDPNAGTGYFKTTWAGSEIKPEMAEVTVTKKSEGPAWGALYWQYFEQLDKITYAETPLKLKKDLFKVENTQSGEVIKPIKNDVALKPGDKVRVRIELRVDRDMQYVHMKDMRAAGFEPINVFSRYKYQDGLGYYESTKDAATNFFFEYLHKGTYVFEYDLRVAHYGDFSNGITTIQCMYAPEFTSHSDGVRVKVEK